MMGSCKEMDIKNLNPLLGLPDTHGNHVVSWGMLNGSHGLPYVTIDTQSKSVNTSSKYTTQLDHE